MHRYKRTLGYIKEGSTEVNEAIVAAGLAWRSAQDAKRRDWLRPTANKKAKAAPKTNHPSPY